MSYIRTKLSKNDKDILADIYEELENINIPTTYTKPGSKGHYHAVKTGVTSQRRARQTSFGLVTYRGKKRLSKSSKKYPYMMDYFNEFIWSHYPRFDFKSVYVNRNTVSKKHKDSKNTGESLLVGFGPYTKGRTVLYTETTAKKIHIKSYSLIFDGSEMWHESEPFNGTRYSLVFF
jgi:hypothetical protein